MTINAKIKASIDAQFDNWEKQLKNKSVTLEEMFDLIGTELLNSVNTDTDEIAQYRCDKLNYLEDVAMKLEESAEIEEDEEEEDISEAQGRIEEESSEIDDEDENN